jgi:hypothetical protein
MHKACVQYLLDSFPFIICLLYLYVLFIPLILYFNCTGHKKVQAGDVPQ